MELLTLISSLKLETTNFVTELNKVTQAAQKKSKDITKAFSTIGRSFKTAGSDLMKLGIGPAAFFAKALKETAEAEKEAQKVKNVLESMGGIKGYSFESLVVMAEEFQAMTAKSKEEVLSAISTLARFGNLSGKEFKKATSLSLDMSAALGIGVEEAAQKIGKIFTDLGGAKKMGIVFENEDHLKKMLGSKNELERLKAFDIVYAKMTKRFGGSAANELKTFGGRMAQLVNVTKELFETIGNKLAPVVGFFINVISKAITTLTKFYEKSGLVGKILTYLTAGFSAVGLVAGASLYGIGQISFAIFSLANALPIIVALGKAMKGLFISKAVVETLGTAPSIISTGVIVDGLGRSWAVVNGEVIRTTVKLSLLAKVSKFFKQPVTWAGAWAILLNIIKGILSKIVYVFQNMGTCIMMMISYIMRFVAILLKASGIIVAIAIIVGGLLYLFTNFGKEFGDRVLGVSVWLGRLIFTLKGLWADYYAFSMNQLDMYISFIVNKYTSFLQKITIVLADVAGAISEACSYIPFMGGLEKDMADMETYLHKFSKGLQVHIDTSSLDSLEKRMQVRNKEAEDQKAAEYEANIMYPEQQREKLGEEHIKSKEQKAKEDKEKANIARETLETNKLIAEYNEQQLKIMQKQQIESMMSQRSDELSLSNGF